jgi:urea transport system substrate-binding protein
VHIDSDNQHTWKTIRVGKALEDKEFEVIYSSEKPIRPEPYPDTRPLCDWNLFVDSLLSGRAGN